MALRIVHIVSDEVIIENAFLEMFHLLADNFDDVLDSVIHSVEETLSNDESAIKLQRVEKTLSTMESKRKKLTDMPLDDKITKEAYDAKFNELTRKINQAKGILFCKILCGDTFFC